MSQPPMLIPPLAPPFLASPLSRHPDYGPDLRDAYAHARRLGLCPDDAEDCAMGFLLHKLTRHRPFGQDATIRRCCAQSFAVDARRALTRRTRQEVSLTGLRGPEASTAGEGEQETAAAGEWGDVGPTPEQALLSVALGAYLLTLLLRLRPAAALLMRRHYLEGEGVGELAVATAQSAHAVEQALYRSRRRLRAVLEAEGLGAADLL